MSQISNKFSNDNYILCPGFAIVELHLSGNELLCYSLIYGMTQDGQSEFYGSLNYVASALNVTKQNAKHIIDRLVAKGLLTKKEIDFSGVKFCHYIANRNSNTVAETITPVAETATPVIETATPVIETATDNINKNINKDINKDIKEKRDKKENAGRAGSLKRTSEALCVFADSKFNEIGAFCNEFSAPEYADVDIAYYYGAVADWSSQHNKKKNDWIATARNFMRKDAEDGKLHKKKNVQADAAFYEMLQREIELG